MVTASSTNIDLSRCSGLVRAAAVTRELPHMDLLGDDSLGRNGTSIPIRPLVDVS
jgi:hypothetical protein